MTLIKYRLSSNLILRVQKLIKYKENESGYIAKELWRLMLIHSKYARNKNIWALSLYPVDMCFGYLLLQVFNTAYTYSSGHVYGLSYFGTIPQLVKLYFQAIKSSESFMTLSIWSWVYIYVVSSFWVHVITASPCQASFNDTSNSQNRLNTAEKSA